MATAKCSVKYMSNKYEFKGSTINGKWKVSTNDDGIPCVIQAQSGWCFGTSYIVEELGQTDFAEADAHLIASAPDLLNMCIELQQILSPLVLNPVHKDIMKQLKQVIHKALNIN